MKIYENAAELIGKTPIIRLKKIEEQYNLIAKLFAKFECFNPAGSIKDRVALNMIDDAEKRGFLKKGSVIIEPTSGNTGIGLASMGISRGYEVILTMPETMSVERRKLLLGYGAKIVLTEGAKGMQGAIDKAMELVKNTPNSFCPSQFDNPANPAAHVKSTAVEIFDDMDGKIDVFVAGVGTGGTVSGIGGYLKNKIDGVKVVAVEPDSSPVITKGVAGAHKIQGIGANFVPKNLNREILDEVLTVTNEDAFAFAKKVGKSVGILVGISSGACLAAMVEEGKKQENEGKNIVGIFPDGGDRYLSTPLFDEE